MFSFLLSVRGRTEVTEPGGGRGVWGGLWIQTGLSTANTTATVKDLFITRRSVFIITAIRFYWSRMKPKAVVAVPPGGNVSVTLSPCVIHAASSY